MSAAQPGGAQGGFPRFPLRGCREAMGVGGPQPRRSLESGRGALSRGQGVAPPETVDVEGKDRAGLGVDGLRGKHSQSSTYRLAPPVPPSLRIHFAVCLSGLMMSVHHRLADKLS